MFQLTPNRLYYFLVSPFQSAAISITMTPQKNQRDGVAWNRRVGAKLPPRRSAANMWDMSARGNPLELLNTQKYVLLYYLNKQTVKVFSNIVMGNGKQCSDVLSGVGMGAP